VSAPRPGFDRPDDELVFRTLAAPGLEEDDLFAAMYGLPGKGVLWGDGRPTAFAPADEEWDAEAERRRRHEALLRKWSPPRDWPAPRSEGSPKA
jgi:hypothetical protein